MILRCPRFSIIMKDFMGKYLDIYKARNLKKHFRLVSIDIPLLWWVLLLEGRWFKFCVNHIRLAVVRNNPID